MGDKTSLYHVLLVIRLVFKMVISRKSIDKSWPQDAASKKKRALARTRKRHQNRAILAKSLHGTKNVKLAAKKENPEDKTTLAQLHRGIKVIKRRGGSVRFARALSKYRKNLKKPSSHTIKLAEGKEPQKPKKGSNKFRVCRMRRVYHTQLPMKFAPSKGSAKHVNRPTKLRKSLTPGTVCIFLAGTHKGKKCVFLKQLRRSGLLIVTGPHRINGIPLRRVDQSHVIATSVKVNLGSWKVPGKIDDFWFKNRRGTKKQSLTKAHESVLEGKKGTDKSKKSKLTQKKLGPSIDRKVMQKVVDTVVLKAMKQHKEGPMVKRYIRRQFGLIGDRYPHNMNF